jgi:SAM-dependent methyltransferase
LKGHELRYVLLEPFLPFLYRRVRAVLNEIVESSGARPFELLDVGGRRSPYTIGVQAQVTVSDLKRESDVQKRLNLGFTESLVEHLKSNRSNIREVIYDDMTRTALSPASFDGVVAVEVLEHVEEDAQFVRQAARTLRPGGSFVMTTPNGEWIPNKNPDHKRHYTRQHLEDLLRPHFSRVTVEYAVRTDAFYRMSNKPWSFRDPVRALRGMIGNALSNLTSSRDALRRQASGTAHLIAVAVK